MTGTWTLTLPCTRAEAEYLTGEVPDLAGIEPAPTLVANEPDESKPDSWLLTAYFADKPDPAHLKLIHSLIPSAAKVKPKAEQLPDEDWVTMSQSALKPVRAGRFFVHTSAHADDAPRGTIPLLINAGQAFGTGGHDTTEGCLNRLDQMERQGMRFRNIADIGTGTGILAFAARHLWPRARIMASDIDPASITYAADYAAANDLKVGRGVGQIALVTASGTDHPQIRRRAPYDLMIANILAGPLIELAPSIDELIADGGSLILAGLLGKQQDAVVGAYRRHGFRLVSASGSADWPTLHLIRRARRGHQRPVRATGRTSQPPGDFGSW
ncbi:MAG TPA: 50S ribosomal protein L11 methyltransferase [Chakrabartia sp.]|nr:50S ribosomal protein L11 methyltransferase [Chakrabartia sp.]